MCHILLLLFHQCLLDTSLGSFFVLQLYYGYIMRNASIEINMPPLHMTDLA